ncbi:MAG: hypothetical protein ACK4GU_13390 [Alishewanella aestuarii]
MKKSILVLTLILAFLPHFSHSETSYAVAISYRVYSGTSLLSISDGSVTPSALVTDCVYTTQFANYGPCIGNYAKDKLTVVVFGIERELTADSSGRLCVVGSSNCSLHVRQSVIQPTTNPPEQTCKGLEGGVIDSLHSTDTPFCAAVASNGPGAQPLLCLSTCGEVCVGTSAGYQHYVSSSSCSSVTGPDGGNDDGGGDDGGGCTENCNGVGDPTQPGDGGSSPTIPDTSGNPTTVQVNIGGTFNGPNGVTNVNLTLDQDLKPLTDRINETNARLNALQQGQQTTNSTLTQIQQGQQTTNSRLSDISSGIAGLTSAIDGLNFNSSGIESGLSDINTTLQTGSMEGGAQMAGDINFPGEVEFENQIASVVTKITTGDNQQAIDKFGKLGESLTSFESLQDLFSMASDNCSPIPFGNYSLDLCGAAQISRSVLNWVVAVLLIIFLVKSVVEDLKRLRMT